MDKIEALKLLQQAIYNIPDGAEIVDLFTEHSYGDSEARIIICIESGNCSVEEFHDIAHCAFNTDMGFIS